jgi:hypothetical protein
MRHQYTATLLSSSVLGVALIMSTTWNAEAATLNIGDFPDANFSVVSDTPTFLDLKFDSPLTSDKGPLTQITITGSAENAVLGPIIPVFRSEFWNVSAQTRTSTIVGEAGGEVPFSLVSLYLEQVIQGQNELPKGSFYTFSQGLYLPLQRVSYLADSSPQIFSSFSIQAASSIVASVTSPPAGSADQSFIQGDVCARGSANCVSSDLTSAVSQDPTTLKINYDYELRGFFQPPDSTEPVPEPSSIVGSLAALLALVGFTKLRRSLAKA